MPKFQLKEIYTAASCNRTVESADWGKNNLIAFGSCNAVCIADAHFNGNSMKIIKLYAKHKKRVNTVRWINSYDGNTQYLLSGSDDKTVIFWNLRNLNDPVDFSIVGHESGVNAVDGIQCVNGDWILATAAADSTLKLWHFDNAECKCFQSILLQSGFCFTLKLEYLPKSERILLAFTSDDETVSLWTQEDKVVGQKCASFQFWYKLTGHEDWVRSLDFVRHDDDLLLASAAQDNFIRLWRISPRTETEVIANKVDIYNLIESTAEIRLEEKILDTSDNEWFAVKLDSVLYGHEGWVYAVNWHQSENGALRLLSASIDKSMVIWSQTTDGVWMESVRVGEVGGNSLGFFGGKFAPDGKSILGHSYQGGFHIWNQSEEFENDWIPQIVAAGHFDEVRDLRWEPNGEFLLSVSADQTTRIHGPWRKTAETENTTWHELARPQVHGYDMQAIACISRYKFASGAEEKIVRTFQSPANYIENFQRITKIYKDPEGEQLIQTLPKGASVPSLGLSNKAVFESEIEINKTTEVRHVKDEYPENYFIPVNTDTPPTEETLMQNTLWPEMQKLYGHGYEIYALAATPDGKLLVSSCKATNPEHAKIILWDTETWKQVGKLGSHVLTVTQMSFSPNGQYLVSVSRDRRWCLFERNVTSNATTSYELIATTSKANGVHGRIIWSCDWSHDSTCFATSSRDGKAAIWSYLADKKTSEDFILNGWYCKGVLELKNESITAIAFATKTINEGVYILALGFETGYIRIYQFDSEWSLLLTLNNDQAHHLTVRRLQFRPAKNLTSNVLQLASCGDDHLVRLYEIYSNA